MTRRLKAMILALGLLAAPSTAAEAGAAPRLPPGFLGVSPQVAANQSDYSLMRKAGVRSVRVPLYWVGVESHSPYLVPPNWTEMDNAVRIAARNGMRVMPFVWGTPPWLARDSAVEPSWTGVGLRAWAGFLRRAVRRYGPRGFFWRENPELRRLPVRRWELWNEENIVSFSVRSNPERFAKLIKAGGRVIHRLDRGAEVIVGGFFGHPLQIPPNVDSADFLDRLYQAGAKPYFDGVGLHPYVTRAGEMRGQIRALRRVMRRHGDGRAKLYLTELGWGSDSNESRWERGLRGQAHELQRSMAMLARKRRAWRIGGVWWFSWTDIESGCYFCDSSGLLTRDRRAKPSWYRFVRWTGGDPSVVPPMAGLGRR